MNQVLLSLHVLAGLVVLAEALNKLQRTDPLQRGLAPLERLCEVLKALAWWLLALGAGGALAAPMLLTLGIRPDAMDALMRLDDPTLAETCVLLGFAVLIVRTRFKEG